MGNTQGDTAAQGNLSDANFRQVQILASSSHFNITDVKALHAKFKALAAESPDCDQITKSQWRDAARSAGIQGADVYLEQLWNHFDDTKSNTIGFREFVLGLSAMCRGSARQKLELSFEIYDTENNGRISQEEMASLLMSMDSHALQYLAATKGNKMSSQQLVAEEKKRKQKIVEYVAEVFAENDVSRTGYLNMKEYTQAVLKHPALLSYRADNNVLSQINMPVTPTIPTSSENGVSKVVSSAAPPDWAQKELALIALITDMKSVISKQARRINELEWEKREGTQNLEMQAQLRRLKAAPIQGGRHGYIAYGVKKGYILYDEATQTIVPL